MWRRDERILRKYEQVLLIIGFLGVPFAICDWFALHWKAWGYGSTSTLNIHVGTEIETYLFSAAIFFAVAAATLIGIARTDRINAANRRKVISKRKSPRRVTRPAYATKSRKPPKSHLTVLSAKSRA